MIELTFIGRGFFSSVSNGGFLFFYFLVVPWSWEAINVSCDFFIIVVDVLQGFLH